MPRFRKLQRTTCGYGVVWLCISMGCGPSQQGVDQAPSRSVEDSGDGKPGNLPNVDRDGLDEAVVRSIDEAMNSVHLAPRSADRWGRLGMLLLAHDQFVPAADCLAHAATLNRVDGRWPYLEAIATRTLDPPRSIDRMRRAAVLFGDQSVVPRTQLAELLIESEQLDEAEKLLSELTRRRPDNTRALIAQAKLGLLRNQPRQALESIERASGSNSPTRSMLLLSAEAYRRLGDWEMAAKKGELARAARSVIWDDPIYGPVRALRTGLKVRLSEADRLYQENRVNESIQMLEHLVRDYPNSEWARILLARGFIRKRELKQAEATLKEALRLNPNSFQANFRMGVLYQVGGQHKHAIDWFEKSLQLQPSNAVSLKNVAMSQFILGERESAGRNLKRAVEVQPNYFDGYLALGDFYLKTRDPTAARAAFRAARNLRPNDRRVTQVLKQLDATVGD